MQNIGTDLLFSAGSRDSPLTNHGVIQAKRLGDYLCKTRPKLSHVFASPLQRALKTAIAVQTAQVGQEIDDADLILPVVQSKDLVEQDFGFYEGKPFYARTSGSNKTGREAHYETHRNIPGFQDVESRESIAARCDSFLDGHFIPLLDYDGVPSELSVVVVSHGILLSHLWRALLRRLPRKSVTIAPEIVANKDQVVLEHLGGWSNTGFLELLVRHSLLDYPTNPELPKPINQAETDKDLAEAASESAPEGVIIEERSTAAAADPQLHPPSPSHGDVELGQISVTLSSENIAIMQSPFGGGNDATSAPLKGFVTTILTVNGQEHLRGVKRTRGGIGSARHDDSQKSIQTFFNKAKKA